MLFHICRGAGAAGLLLAALAPVPAAAQQDLTPAEVAAHRARREVRAILTADAVVLGRVREVHPTPGVWCGIVVTWQQVTYDVDEVLHGSDVPRQIRVGHMLVGGGLVCEHAPFLRPELFQPGSRFLLCLKRDRDAWLVNDESYGARPLEPARTPDATHVALVRLLLAQPELRPRDDATVLKIQLGAVVPLPIDIPQRAVEFLPPELVRGERALRITAIRIEQDRAELDYELGTARGTFRAQRRGEQWVAGD